MAGFEIRDHAGYADFGEDIVCAAVSALVINCVNSIEALTDADFQRESREEDGMISLKLKDPSDPKAQLLLSSLLLGLEGVEAQYSDNMDLIIREV